MKNKQKRFIFLLLVGFVGLLTALTLSVVIGAADISFQTVIAAIFSYDATENTHQIIRNIRIPRVIGACIVGASLSVSGALMQSVTQNPLADSGLLGLNAGAAFMMTISMSFFPSLPYIGIVSFCFLGAGLSALLIYLISTFNQKNAFPLKLILVGSAVTVFLSSVSQIIALMKNVGQDIAFWYVGGTANITWLQLKWLMPMTGVGLLGAIYLARSVFLLSLGEETAKGLGQNVPLVRMATMIVVILLTGISVAIVGPISFLGLMVPHMMRKLIGADDRLVIPLSALYGGLIVVLADFGGRMLNPPFETPFGAIIAVIGIPFFLYLTRKGGAAK